MLKNPKEPHSYRTKPAVSINRQTSTEKNNEGITGAPKGGVLCSADTFVQAESSVLRIKFCGKSPALRVAANRCIRSHKEQNGLRGHFLPVNAVIFITFGISLFKILSAGLGQGGYLRCEHAFSLNLLTIGPCLAEFIQTWLEFYKLRFNDFNFGDVVFLGKRSSWKSKKQPQDY